MPGKVNIQVPKEQAAERNRRKYVTVLEFQHQVFSKTKVPPDARTGCPLLRVSAAYLNCSKAQNMPLFLPMVASVELMDSKLP